MKRRLLAGVCVAAMMGLQVGCSGGAAPTTQAALDQKAEETKAAGERKEAASQEPTQIWVAIREDINNFPEGTMDILKESVKEKFNVDLKIDCISQSSYEEKLNVMIASGSFPDIIRCEAIPRLGEAVEGGLLLPMTEFVKNDALWSTADPVIFGKYSYKGEIYGLPTVLDRPDSIYYRTDWLEKLGLSVPTTTDELYEVLKAFAKNDPDGNGQDDTYGLTFPSNYLQTAPLWQLFLKGNPLDPNDFGFYTDPETNQADNVFNHKEDVAEALIWFNKLYEEGILDKEFVLNTKEDAENKFVTGKAGAWVKGLMFIEPRQAKAAAANPDAKILSFPNIEGKYGTNLKIQPMGGSYYLTRSAQGKEDIARQVLAYIAGPEGATNMWIGKEGVTYNIEGDKINWTNPDDAKKYNPGNLLLNPFPVDLPVPSTLLEANMKETEGYEMVPSIQTWNSPTYNEKGADMKKVIIEGITKIIIGEEPIEYLDTMIETLNSLGMQEVCNELNSK